MRDKNTIALLTGDVVENSEPLSLVELCRMCGVSTERIIEIVAEGVVEPRGEETENWSFHAVSVQRVRFVLNMERDLGVNTAGSALALELLEELEQLRKRLKQQGADDIERRF